MRFFTHLGALFPEGHYQTIQRLHLHSCSNLFSINNILMHVHVLVLLYIIINMRLIRSKIFPTSCVAQPSQDKQLWPSLIQSHNQNMKCNSLAFCIVSSLQYSFKTSEFKTSHFHLNEILISLLVYTAACIMCMSSLLLICWRVFLMFGVWVSVPRFLVFSSVPT